MRAVARAGAALIVALAAPLALSAPLADSTPLTSPIAVDSAQADGDCTPGTRTYSPTAPPALAMLEAEKAWKHATGAGVVVAVVDSGIDASNVHFRGAIIGGINLVPDGLDPYGMIDQQGHGTEIAGQIAARRYDQSGVVGLAPDSVLLSVRVYASTSDDAVEAGFGPSAELLAQGIRWAVDNGADIINVSLSDYSESAGLEDAVNYAISNGALVVASAGNRGTTGYTDDSVRYPAGYDGVLGVTATNDLGVVTDDSIHGPQVAVAAPGANVITSAAYAGDCLFATEVASSSYATGYASGAAALVAQAHPTESPAQWKYRLEASARRANIDARDDNAGWGVIQPYDAITLVPSATTRGPESPFADTTEAALDPADVTVKPHPSNSPMAQTREIMLVVAVTAASVLGIFGVVIVLGRARRSAKKP